MSPTHLPHVVRALLERATRPLISGGPSSAARPGTPQTSPASSYVLLTLVLFVIWLLAIGYDLASATAAAVAVSWAAGTSSGGALPPGGLPGVLPGTGGVGPAR